MKVNDTSWQSKIWQVPGLDDFEFLHATNVTYDYPAHIHEEYSIALILKGTERTHYRNISSVAPPGSFLLFNPEEVHSSRSVGTEYRTMKIKPNPLNRIAFEYFGHTTPKLNFPKLVINDALMFRILLKLHLRLEQSASPFEQESHFISTIGQLVARYSKNSIVLQSHRKEPNYVKLIRDYLRSHYSRNVTLAHLSSITNLSPFYLLRVFRNQVGCTPHEYQTQVRITRARKLIRKGHSISDVSLETGFFDQSHLSKNFKRIVGISPGQYSRQCKIVQDTSK
jgi:AraC-like DNA-binding protein